MTARSAHDDLFAAITGKQSAADRMWVAYEHIEKATELLDRHDLGFAFPVKGMLLKHYRAEPLEPWWKEVVEHYNQWLIELYRSREASHPRGRGLLFYYAKRSEYNFFYVTAVEALRNAAIAREKGDNEKALAEIEKAIEAVNDAMEAVGFVAHDQSDRGLVAILKAYAYDPLVEEYERMLDASE